MEDAESRGSSVAISPSESAATKLTGELTVRVWSKKGGNKSGLRVEEPGALPLLAGEQVHVEARLNQPAHAYLVWVDGTGRVSVLYPRDDGKFGSEPPPYRARQTFDSPSAIDEGHTMTGPGGLETVLLLVRRTPLPSDTDVAALVGPLPAAPLNHSREVTLHGFDEGKPIDTLQMHLNRGIAEEAQKIDDPLLRLIDRLETKHHFELIKAVRFAYRGE
jgi:hypothetical protein